MKLSLMHYLQIFKYSPLLILPMCKHQVVLLDITALLIQLILFHAHQEDRGPGWLFASRGPVVRAQPGVDRIRDAAPSRVACVEAIGLHEGWAAFF